MIKHSEKRDIELMGIDLAKRSFQLHGLDRHGQLVVGKKLSRAKVKTYLANLPPCRVATTGNPVAIASSMALGTPSWFPSAAVRLG